MEYEWNDSKNQSNLIKHGIDFDYAIYVFLDENRVVTIDDRKDYGEIRYKVIGKIDVDIITLIYTIRDEFYRIISARGARKDEKQDYSRNISARQQAQVGWH
ncbi:MAG TPA: BrnT family toxin [Gammaproteobacteria bacterium]|nr:BrnT family toxin [Gammaproteobacteria bacterium]